ncbi:MYXO-CTERM sorting domain-containing protein [Archangium lansingense]|uniref:MYXO-CTERM sorting domain-containing protein n=1 Tax=Archangium lansingense TaxID=2995310 RepID=UPI003B7605AB
MMDPTGSIFGRSWRTSWGVRVRLLSLGVVAGLVMLAAAGAHADWRTDVSIPERPNDVLEVWGQNRFAVGFPEGAYMFVDGGVPRDIPPRSPTFESAGTYYQPAQDCFVSVDKAQGVPRGVRVSDGSSCGSFNAGGDPIIPEGTLLRVKHAANGGAAAVTTNGVEYAFYMSGTNIYDNLLAFRRVTASMSNVHSPIGLVRVAGTDYLLIGTTANTSTVYWVEGDNLGSAVSWRQSTSDMGIVSAIDMFSAGNPAKPYAVVGTQFGLLQGSTSASMDPIKPVQMLGGSVSSVSMNVGFGGDAGQGFGMAVVQRPDGSRQVVSPVPMLSDTKAGTVWQYRSLPPSVASAPLEEVACTGASYCVLTADRVGGGNIFIYTNDAGPELSVTAPGATVVGAGGTDVSVTLDEGQTYRLTFAAQDPDGDPVLVTDRPPSAPSGVWTWVPVAGYGPGDPVVWDVTTSTVCKTKDGDPFQVLASDGLAQHQTYKSVQLNVKHTRAPEPPAVVLSDGGVSGSGAVGELVPGGEPLTLRLAGNGTTAAGCRLQPQWEPLFSGSGVPSLQQVGGTAVITPPDRFCSPTAGNFGFRLHVTDEGGLSNTSDFNVQVAPWGRPNAVFNPDAGVEFIAGRPNELVPDGPVHVCKDSSASFPGVDTEWSVTLPDGGVPGNGFIFRKPGGELVQAFPVRAEKLVVEAAETLDCAATELLASAKHILRPDTGISGPESKQHVRFRTLLEPTADGAPQFSLVGGAQPSDVWVDSTLNCPDDRLGKLRADVWLEPLEGGKRLYSGTVSVPGPWKDVPLATMGCGRPLLVKGVLEDDTGQRSQESELQVPTPPSDAGLETLPEASALVARCGEPARVTLTQTFPSWACQTPDVTWTQVSGPPLEQTSLSGQTVSLVTRDTGLDALVGESLEMDVTASVGPGNEVSQRIILPITVEPFVKVRRRTEVPAASETGLVGVSVDLLNTTACEVRGVSYVERLQGLTYVEGSAKFDGQPVEATWVEGALTVTGLTLAGEGSGRLTYVARPHLVGERRMEGEARLRNAVISLSDKPGPQVPDSGCGCSGSGPGPMLFALGALVAAVRRRRR